MLPALCIGAPRLSVFARFGRILMKLLKSKGKPYVLMGFAGWDRV